MQRQSSVKSTGRPAVVPSSVRTSPSSSPLSRLDSAMERGSHDEDAGEDGLEGTLGDSRYLSGMKGER